MDTIAEIPNLAAYYGRKVEQRRKTTGALSYPLIVLCTSACPVFFMLHFVVTMFTDVFRRFGGKLPWMNALVIKASGILGSLFLPVVVIMAAISYWVYRKRKKESFRKISSALLLKIPLVGDLVSKVYLARFCNTMRLLIATRIPLLRAIEMSAQTIGFYPVEVSLKRVEQDIMQWKALHRSLQEFAIYPAKMIQLVKVGEEINKLDDFFGNIAERYIQEVEHWSGTLSKMIEPFIIVFLGLVVGFILIAMYLPMFEMSNSF